MSIYRESAASKTITKSTSFETVKQFLKNRKYPKGLCPSEKRTLRRRVKSFVLIGDELFVVGGRYCKALAELTDTDENPENEPDHTQTLKKVLFTEEEQQAAVDQAHIAEDGSHMGIERTRRRVTEQYFWTQIKRRVIDTIHNCSTCQSKKTSSRTEGSLNNKNPVSLGTPATSAGTASECSHFERGELEDAADFEMGEDVGVLNEEIDGTGDAAAYMNIQTVNMTALPSMEQVPILEHIPKLEHVPKQNSSYFWQKVEIQVFGPYQADGQQVYVAIALDCYSQFPEAAVMKTLSSATVTNFVLNLFCRYGMMEKLLLLQNKVTKNKDFIVNTNDLLQAGVSPSVFFPEIDPLDERWLHIEKSLDRFVSMHPKIWYHCLEMCLMPLRVALPTEADYSPYFLTHGREPTLPKKLTEHWNIQEPGMCEVQLTEDQEKQAVEIVMAAFSTDNICLLPGSISVQNNPVDATMAELGDHQYAVHKPEKRLSSAQDSSQIAYSSILTMETDVQKTKQNSLSALPRTKLKDGDSQDTALKEHKSNLVFQPSRAEDKMDTSASTPVLLIILQKTNNDQTKQDNLATTGQSMIRHNCKISSPIDATMVSCPVPSVVQNIHLPSNVGDNSDCDGDVDLFEASDNQNDIDRDATYQPERRSARKRDRDKIAHGQTRKTKLIALKSDGQRRKAKPLLSGLPGSKLKNDDCPNTIPKKREALRSGKNPEPEIKAHQTQKAMLGTLKADSDSKRRKSYSLLTGLPVSKLMEDDSPDTVPKRRESLRSVKNPEVIVHAQKQKATCVLEADGQKRKPNSLLSGLPVSKLKDGDSPDTVPKSKEALRSRKNPEIIPHAQMTEAMFGALEADGQRRKPYSLLSGLAVSKLKDGDSSDTVAMSRKALGSDKNPEIIQHSQKRKATCVLKADDQTRRKQYSLLSGLPVSKLKDSLDTVPKSREALGSSKNPVIIAYKQNATCTLKADGPKKKQYSLLSGLPVSKLTDGDSPNTVPKSKEPLFCGKNPIHRQFFLVALHEKQDTVPARWTKGWKKSLSVMRELSFDTFCFLLAQYIQFGTFPAGLSAIAKQSVIRFRQMVHVKDGKLYSNVGKSSLRRFVTGEKARFGILRKAHISGEEHHSRARALKFLADNKLFWKGMSRDLDAFIHGCSECMLHNPLHNKPVVRIPSKSAELSAEVDYDDDPHLSEDEEEETPYEHIIKFITDGTFPSTVTPFERSHIELRSKSMCMIDEGSSQYLAKIVNSTGSSEPKFSKVLITEDSRQSAIHGFHIENGQHLSAQVTQSRLRKHYFWRGMTVDVLVYVSKCCMEKTSKRSHVPHLNPDIQSRVDKFQKYYAGGAFPKLDTTLIAGVDLVNTSNRQESENMGTAEQILQKESVEELKSPQHSNQTVDKYVVKVVEQIIDRNCKALIGSDEHGSGTNMQLASSKHGVYKNVHKCPYCGKIIRGKVAIKVHIYKHTGTKPFMCDVCGLKFTSREGLSEHNRLHTGVKPYLCSYCGLGFHKRKMFSYHLRKHSKTKITSVTCDVCGLTCAKQCYLDIHKRFKHTSQAHLCNQCGKCFTVAWRLKRHEKSHLGIRK